MPAWIDYTRYREEAQWKRIICMKTSDKCLLNFLENPTAIDTMSAGFSNFRTRIALLYQTFQTFLMVTWFQFKLMILFFNLFILFKKFKYWVVSFFSFYHPIALVDLFLLFFAYAGAYFLYFFQHS